MGSSRFVDVHKWVGQDAAPLDPESMQYRSRLVDEGARRCTGCAFNGQNWRICVKAAALAVKASMHDCDDIDEKTQQSFVYILVEQDARQQSLIDGAD